MNILIDVTVSFNKSGEIKPLYIRYKDWKNDYMDYKIERVNSIVPEYFAGINTILFNCTIITNEQEKDIIIKYFIKAHKWNLIN